MADAPRLLEHATAAFVDRATIDWPALLSRVHTSPDRALFENLYALAAVRSAARKATLGALAFAAASVPLGAATFRDRRSLFLLATFTSLASTFTRSTVGGLPAAWSAP